MPLTAEPNLVCSLFFPSTVVCGPPPHVEHAEHDADPGVYRFATGTTLNYACQFGYYREGSPRAICSGPKGSWAGPSMTCKGRTAVISSRGRGLSTTLRDL